MSKKPVVIDGRTFTRLRGRLSCSTCCTVFPTVADAVAHDCAAEELEFLIAEAEAERGPDEDEQARPWAACYDRE